MKKFILGIMLLAAPLVIFAADEYTTNYGFIKIDLDSEDLADPWGAKEHRNWDAADLAIKTVAVSTGPIQTQVNAIAVSTGTHKVQIDAVAISTGAHKVQIDAVAVSTGALYADLATEVSDRGIADAAIAVSTGTQADRIEAVAVSTGTQAARIEAVAVSTGNIYLALNSTAAALTSEISRATTREDAIAVSTGAHKVQIDAVAVSTGALYNSKVDKAGDTMTGNLIVGASVQANIIQMGGDAQFSRIVADQIDTGEGDTINIGVGGALKVAGVGVISQDRNVTGSNFYGDGSTLTGVITSTAAIILSTGVIKTVQDAIILSTGVLDAAKVNRAGDTMTGQLTTSSSMTAILGFVGPLIGNADTATSVPQTGVNLSTVTAAIATVQATISTAVYTTDSYADPNWLTSLSTSKIDLSTVTADINLKVDKSGDIVTGDLELRSANPNISFSTGTNPGAVSLSLSGGSSGGYLWMFNDAHESIIHLDASDGEIRGTYFIGSGASLTGVITSTAVIVLSTGTLDLAKVNRTGDTMTGNLIVGASVQANVIVASSFTQTPELCLGGSCSATWPAGGGASGDPDIVFTYIGDTFDSATTFLNGVSNTLSKYAFTPAAYDVYIGSATTDTFTVVISTKTFMQGWATVDTLTIPVGVSTHTATAAANPIAVGTLVKFDFNGVLTTDPAGDITVRMKD